MDSSDKEEYFCIGGDIIFFSDVSFFWEIFEFLVLYHKGYELYPLLIHSKSYKFIFLIFRLDSHILCSHEKITRPEKIIEIFKYSFHIFLIGNRSKRGEYVRDVVFPAISKDLIIKEISKITDMDDIVGSDIRL